MKKTVLAMLAVGSFAAAECDVFTSPIDFSVMRGGYATWFTSTKPIVNIKKNYEFKSFVQAYKEFDEYVRKEINEKVCGKNKWSGAANYKIVWQQTEHNYVFTATFDTFAYK